VKTATDEVGELAIMYLDTAIIIKLLVRETDSAWFNRALAGQRFETSELAIAEVRSALLAKERAGHITPVERVVAEERFYDMIEDELIKLHTLNRSVLERASAIQLACHPKIPLRTLDALHVATCDLHRIGTLATTDGRMRLASQQFAITLVPSRMEDMTAAS
jgi:predicted nucleic acid-binding protein